MILGGVVDVPDFALPLIRTLEACVGIPGGHKWVDDSASSERSSPYAFGKGVDSSGSDLQRSSSRGSASSHLKKKRNNSTTAFPPASWGKSKNNGSYFTDDGLEDHNGSSWDNPRLNSPPINSTDTFPTKFDSDFSEAGVFSSSRRETSMQKPTYTPGSPFNDLPPFPAATGRDIRTHNRAFSEALPRSRMQAATHPFDPFSASEDLTDGVQNDSSRRALTHTKSHTVPKIDLPSIGVDDVGRAVALYNFSAVEVRQSLIMLHND